MVRPRYAYPLVQYKVIDRIPVLTGFQEGAELLVSLFLKIREIDIEGQQLSDIGKKHSAETMYTDCQPTTL
ncbi:MAG: hypothetical protein AB2L20_03955 [Mangrovibacterium sp.]